MGLLLAPIFLLWLLFWIPAQRVGSEYVSDADRKAVAVGILAACSLALSAILFAITLVPFTGRQILGGTALGLLLMAHIAIAVAGRIALTLYRTNRRQGCLLFAAASFVCAAILPITWFGVIEHAIRLVNVTFSY
jgi:hypothetical protein